MSERRTRLREQVSVEPLDGVRLERIEQRVVAQAGPLLARPRRAPWTPWLVAGSAALAAAAVVLALGIGRGGSPRPSAPVVVATDAQGTRVDLGDAVVEVGPDTRFEVVRADGGIAIELATGDVRLEVAPRQARPPLWVHAGQVGVRVVGTAFSVHRGDTVEVEVDHGAVEVHRGDELDRVATGERWSSTDGEVIAVASLGAGRAPTSAGLTAPVATAVGGGGSATIAADELALGPTAAGVGLRDRRPGLTPPTRADVATPRNGSTAGGTAARTIDRSQPTPPVRATPPVVVRPPPELRAEVLAQPLGAAPALPAGVAATNPEQRAAAFQRIAATSRGADAASATYGLAHTQAALGKDAEALRTLNLYVARFSSGADMEAVLWLRLRLLCKRALDEPCRAAAHTYLARFAGTTRGALATRVTQSR